jgi:hypothetical protein
MRVGVERSSRVAAGLACPFQGSAGFAQGANEVSDARTDER